MIYIITIILGGIIGFFLASYIKNKELDIKKVQLEERGKDIDQLESRFKAVAGDVLRNQSKDFSINLESKEKNFDRIAQEINKSMKAVDEKISDFEKMRAEQTGSLGKSIETVLNAGAKMQEEVGTVKNLLSSASAVRGKWGELLLKTILEKSDLNEGVVFQTQETVTGDNANLRPDVIITLPDGLKLAIDSKASLEEFDKAVVEKNAEKRKEHIVKFTQHIKERIKELSSKEYQKYVDPRVPYVVMFIPSEAAIRAVVEEDMNLYTEAQDKKVMLASPAIIMPLLSLIAHAWRQQKTIENASKLAEEITDLGDRINTFFGHFAGIGASLEGATKKFNAACASLDSRVYPKIKDINNLGGKIQIDASANQIDIEPRTIKIVGKKSKSKILEITRLESEE